MLLVLAWPSSSCGGNQGGLSLGFDLSRPVGSEDAASAEATLRRYLEAVEQHDADAQAALWVNSQKSAARRESEKYARLDTTGVKITDFHAQATDWPDHIIVHYNEVLPARGRIVTKAGLLQKVDNNWMIKDLR